MKNLVSFFKNFDDFFILQGENPQRTRGHLWRIATFYKAKIKITGGVYVSTNDVEKINIFRVQVLDRGELDNAKKRGRPAKENK